ncbi:hypothetical protein B5S32_g2760 [[Candida] boidinii]|nr:hypothetical protein B5S32_g2760 [[Candida] boidinii]
MRISAYPISTLGRFFTPSKEVIESFKDYIDNSHRCIILTISNEVLSPSATIPGSSDLISDLTSITNKITTTEPCYIIIKEDTTTNTSTNNYYFISWVPDEAKVKDKMIYASAKNNILKDLGLEFFKSILFMSELNELSESGWKSLQNHENSIKPLSDSEKSLKNVKNLEMLNSIGLINNKKKLVNDNNLLNGSLNFKINNDLLEILSNNSDFKNGEFISINIINEILVLKLSDELNPNNISSIIDKLPSDSPNYTILKLNDLFYFIYSCPSGSKVKDRMIYASNKLGFINNLKNNLNFNFAKIIEIGDSDEIELSEFEINNDSKSDITSDSGLNSSFTKLKFSKPKGPRRR